jgi:hypothetical protein
MRRPDQARPGRKPKIGSCRICGKVGVLSFEHVPPRAAFNRGRVEQFSVEQWLARVDGKPVTRGRIQQRGTGGFTLCESCNNLTGRLYAPELESLSRAGAQIIAGLPPAAEQEANLEQAFVNGKIVGARPLRLAKQIVAMMLAINSDGFGRPDPEQPAFVHDPRLRGLPTRYQLYLVVYQGPTLRHVPLSARLAPDTGVAHYISELAHPPFAYVLSIDEPSPALPIGNISHFADFDFDETAELELQLLVGFGHTMYPLDYRTQAALDRDVAADQADAES